MAVAGKEFRAGESRQVLNGLAGAMTHNFDITPAGKRFLLVTTPTVTTGVAPVVVVNWQRGLTR